MGSAQQFGEADVKGKDFSGQVQHARRTITLSARLQATAINC